jgi:hypothetical protein
METDGRAVGDIRREFSGAYFGDDRLNRRLDLLVESLTRNPDLSFPEAVETDAALEGTYRFLNNPCVQPGRILAPHLTATVGRVAEQGQVVVAHDTTEFNFGPATSRSGLGRVGRGKSSGFYCHVALAVSASDSSRVLGVLGLTTMFRTGPKRGRRGHKALQADKTNESVRWPALVDEVQQRVDGRAGVIHVMDREADSYALLAFMEMRGARFVVRMAQDRVLNQPTGPRTVKAALEGAEVQAEREVPLSSRLLSPLPSYQRLHPPRAARLAKLRFSAVTVPLPRPESSQSCGLPALQINLVHVREVDAPPGEEAVEWRLWTNLPVDTPEQICAVVDAYRARWAIEEYFKALKTGCAFEQRQLESREALLNALAVFAPIACRLLLLRTLSRDQTDAPATLALTPFQLRCLRAALQKIHRRTLSEAPTLREAMLGVARIGGHIQNNGDPGWVVLGRGMDRLLTMEMGASLVENPDQS